MKKLLLLTGICLSAVSVTAQNTYPWPSSGNIGIGTTTPAEKLDVNGNINWSGYNSGNHRALKIGHSGSNYGGLGYNIEYTTTTAIFNRPMADKSSYMEFWNGGFRFYGTDDYSSSTGVNLNGGGTNLNLFATFTNTGRLGIGTDSPSALLEVNGDTRIQNGITAMKSIASETDNAALLFPQSRTTLRFYYASLGETGSGASTILGNNIAVAGQTNNAVIRTVSSVDPAHFIRLNYYHGITFHTNILSTIGQPVSEDTNEAMRITRNGNVLIAKTSQANTAYKLDIGGNVRANEIVVNTTGADFVFAKDYKLCSLADVKAYIDANGHLPDVPSAKTMQEEGVGVSELQTKLLQKIEELTLYVIELSNENKEQGERIKELESGKKKRK